MTEIKKLRSKDMRVTIGAALIVFGVAFGILIVHGVDRDTESYQRSCMDAVRTPDPDSEFYDQQAFEFTAEIRKCLRG
jgi:hypothetical protein